MAAIGIVLISFAVSYPLFNNDIDTYGKVVERLAITGATKPAPTNVPIPKKP